MKLTQELLQAVEAAVADDMGEIVEIIVVAIKRSDVELLVQALNEERSVFNLTSRAIHSGRISSEIASEILLMAGHGEDYIHTPAGSGYIPNAVKS